MKKNRLISFSSFTFVRDNIKRFRFVFFILCIQFFSGQEQERIEPDKTGTDPTNVSGNFLVSNDYQVFSDGKTYMNSLKISASKPFSRKLKMQIVAPYLSSNLPGYLLGGLGNVNVKFNYIASLNQKSGTVVGLEFDLDTTTEELLRTNKNDVKLLFVKAFFLKNKDVFAPSYSHTFSITNHSLQKNTMLGVIDLYYVHRFNQNKNWIKVDPTFVMNYVDNKYYSLVRVEYGQMVADGFSFGINPGIGLGGDSPVDYSLGLSFKIVF